jgi:hypothetical protein
MLHLLHAGRLSRQRRVCSAAKAVCPSPQEVAQVGAAFVAAADQQRIGFRHAETGLGKTRCFRPAVLVGYSTKPLGLFTLDGRQG